MTALRLLAPAKVNWTLEVLRVRPDGYHELRTVLQTLELADAVLLEEAADLELRITGRAGELLAMETPESNLAWRAAEALRRHSGVRAGVRMMIDKRVPVAAGLGGGSSDAAAVLRGCNELWATHLDEAALMTLAASVGSDVPFFITSGTAAAEGRGETLFPLPDANAPDLLLAIPAPERTAEKTARMFRALDPSTFSEGDATASLVETISQGRPVTDWELTNVFERVTGREQPATERAMDALREQGYVPHLAGAGPAFFLLGADHDEHIGERIAELGFTPLRTRTLPRAAALRMERG